MCATSAETNGAVTEDTIPPGVLHLTGPEALTFDAANLLAALPQSAPLNAHPHEPMTSIGPLPTKKEEYIP